MTDIRIAQDTTALAEMAAETIQTLADDAIQARGSFTIALSGGSTPKALFILLASQYHDTIDWNRVFIFWGDERCVPPDHADSNYRMARETLLDHVNLPTDNVFRLKGELPPPEAAEDYERVLHSFFGDELPRLDLILLGMGDDGHTASLFPHTEALKETQRWVVPNYVSAKETWRLTLTALVINNAANVMFLVAGTEKAERLKQVLQGAYQPETLPSQLVKPTNGNLIWGVDQTAAALL
ncbi:MAG: 6-phosphogluconolactonase [Chloroflexi bacterium]|nr:6-phosphogluconolactonase [Chloroflexota bacterium]MCC6892144.1 6-phosphogluconolactonase [Anaerolineae bacterium]